MTAGTDRVLLGATPGVDIAAAVEQYEATERAAWEVYEATERAAWEVYEATERAAWEVYEAAQRPAWEVYVAAQRAAWEVYAATERAAWEQLLAAVQADPFAAWIVERLMPEYRIEALIVLRALPCTLDDLDDLADRHGWYDTYADKVIAARAAGVIPERLQ